MDFERKKDPKDSMKIGIKTKALPVHSAYEKDRTGSLILLSVKKTQSIIENWIKYPKTPSEWIKNPYDIYFMVQRYEGCEIDKVRVMNLMTEYVYFMRDENTFYQIPDWG